MLLRKNKCDIFSQEFSIPYPRQGKVRWRRRGTSEILRNDSKLVSSTWKFYPSLRLSSGWHKGLTKDETGIRRGKNAKRCVTETELTTLIIVIVGKRLSDLLLPTHAHAHAGITRQRYGQVRLTVCHKYEHIVSRLARFYIFHIPPCLLPIRTS